MKNKKNSIIVFKRNINQGYSTNVKFVFDQYLMVLNGVFTK
jgi:hypothetical protein